MSEPTLPPHQQTPVFQFAIVFVVVIIILQMWLLTSSLDEYLGGHDQILLPAAIASACCVAVCWRLIKAVGKENR